MRALLWRRGQGRGDPTGLCSPAVTSRLLQLAEFQIAKPAWLVKARAQSGRPAQQLSGQAFGSIIAIKIRAPDFFRFRRRLAQVSEWNHDFPLPILVLIVGVVDGTFE